MEARGAWCALEGRLTRRVLPMVYSFVCHAISCILLSLPLTLHRVGVHLHDWEGPEGRLKSLQRVINNVHWPT